MIRLCRTFRCVRYAYHGDHCDTCTAYTAGMRALSCLMWWASVEMSAMEDIARLDNEFASLLTIRAMEVGLCIQLGRLPPGLEWRS